MTVAAVARQVIYNGSGTTGPFAFNFRVIASTDITVTKIDADGVRTTLSVGGGAGQYTISLTAYGQSGGVVTLGTALAVGERILIKGNTPLTQAVRYANQGAFYGERHEDSYDKLTLIVQEANETAEKSIRVNDLDSGVDSELPEISANKVIVTNATGDGFDLVSFGSVDASIDTLFTGLAAEDFIKFNGTVWINRTPSQVRTDLGLVIGTNVQAYNVNLAGIAGLTSAADRLAYFTGAGGNSALATLTSYGRTLIATADAAAGRTALALGSAATAGFIDEDSFATDSPTDAPSQQSTKAYIAAQIAAINISGAAKVWAYVTYSAGTPTLADSYGVASITDLGTGFLRVTFTTAFASVNYCAQVTSEDNAAVMVPQVDNKTTTYVDVYNRAFSTGNPADPDAINVACFGDQ